MRKLLLVSALMLGSSLAFAQFTGPSTDNVQAEVANKLENVLSVEQARHLKDDTKVILEGKIVEHLGGDKYRFKDQSGEITIEIDHDDWRGVKVGPEDTVVIYGEVDHHRHKPTDIDVDRVVKKSGEVVAE